MCISSRYRMYLVLFCLLTLCNNLSIVTAAVPTRSPNFGNLPCSICPLSTDVVTNPNTTIPGGTLSFLPDDTTCAVLESAAIGADFKPNHCKSIVESTIPDLCGCATPAAPTTSSVNATPSVAPVAVVTPVAPTPVGIPVAIPVAIPTVPSNITNGTIVTSVSITLSNVSSILNTPNLLASYNSVLTAFLAAMLSSDTVQNLTVSLINQTFLVEDSTSTATMTNTTNTTRVRRLGVRSLQTTTDSTSNSSVGVMLFPLQTEANVTAIVPSSLLTDSGVQLFTTAIVTAVSSNASDLIQAFQVADPTFFGAVTSIQSSPTPPSTVPAPAPVAAPEGESPVAPPAPAPAPKSSDKGLSTGAIAGIIVGAIVLGGGIVGFFASQSSSKPIPPSSSSQSRSTTSNGHAAVGPQDISSSKVYAVKSSTTNKTSSAENKFTRVIKAPPGKLGIVVDTSVNGPIVSVIKPNSPLEGKLFIGDIITLVDGIDTRAMNAAAITSLIVQTAANERKLTVLSAKKTVTPAVKIEDMVTRSITVPPGKLGIVIDTTVNGPVVSKVKVGSPIENKIFVGDVIIGIDGTDTRAMSATAITSLMVESAGNERQLTVLSANKSIVEEESTDKPIVTGDESTTTGEAVAATAVTATAGAAVAVQSANIDEDLITRIVIAPPGKLGIVIDTTSNGPVVHKIKPDSPLEGKLSLGDIITKIDDTDVRTMSASAITALMVQTSANERKLTVLSKEN